MKYVFLLYEDEQCSISASDYDHFDACAASDELLRKSGHLLAMEGFQPSTTATVRVLNGDIFVSDSPVAETTMQIIAIFLIAARDLNEAIQIAATMPQARGGPIEVRPVSDQLAVDGWQ